MQGQQALSLFVLFFLCPTWSALDQLDLLFTFLSWPHQRLTRLLTPTRPLPPRPLKVSSVPWLVYTVVSPHGGRGWAYLSLEMLRICKKKLKVC